MFNLRDLLLLLLLLYFSLIHPVCFCTLVNSVGRDSWWHEEGKVTIPARKYLPWILHTRGLPPLKPT